MNCHGCKWLDEAKRGNKGEGYCCMVVRAKSYQNGDRVRREDSERCELFEEGDFATRYRTKR